VRLLTYDECVAWAKRYRDVPWVSLAMVTATDHEPGPVAVMSSLFAECQRLQSELRKLRRELATAKLPEQV
jgi:hypothetical protein